METVCKFCFQVSRLVKSFTWVGEVPSTKIRPCMYCPRCDTYYYSDTIIEAKDPDRVNKQEACYEEIFQQVNS